MGHDELSEMASICAHSAIDQCPISRRHSNLNPLTAPSMYVSHHCQLLTIEQKLYG